MSVPLLVFNYGYSFLCATPLLSLALRRLWRLLFAVLFRNGARVGDRPFCYASAGFFLSLALVIAFGAIIVAVAYFDLRAAKDGIDVAAVAAVFE